MWSLNLNRVRELEPDLFSRCQVAVESGTCRGNGALTLAKSFPRVLTIELSESLFIKALQRFNGNSKIELLCGDSTSQLRGILPKLSSEPIFFFLDAHWSGDASVDWEASTWKGYGLETAHRGSLGKAPSGPEQCPLAEELEAIVSACRGPALVLIDDMKNLPKEGAGLKDKTFCGEDWSHLSRERLLHIVGPRLRRQYHFLDPEQWLLVLE